MAVSLIASSASGAGLELLFGSFLDLVVDVTKKNIIFQPTLKRLETTLKSLQPKIKQIDAFNLEMDRPKEIDGLKELIIKGQKLVTKCSNTNQYNFVMKPIYTEKLLKLEEEIRRDIDIVMQVQQSVDQKELLFELKQTGLEVSQIGDQFKQLSSIGSNSGSFSRSGFIGVCSPPGLKGEPVGLEAPLKDLKRKLLEDEVPLIVISGPGGCGKTTMALAICQDEDILDKFQDNIFFITVSKSPSLLVIAERLFQHKGQKVPKYRNENDLVVLLENFFRNMTPEPVLLVLDDLWSGSEYILDKLNFQIENYRILVTSRSELSSFDSTYKLQTLNETDALTLFRQSALPQGGNFCISDEDVNKVLRYPSMAVSPIASSASGAGLELLFGSFLDLVVDVTKKNIIFQPTLKRLETTLKSLQPKIKQIDALNLDMDRPKEIDGLKVLIIKGQQLVIKCSNTNQFNFVKKPIYTEKLLKLEEEIRRDIDIVMQVQQSVDQKELLFELKQIGLEVSQIGDQFKQLSSIGSNSGSFSRSGLIGVCSPPGLIGEPVGLEAPLKDLKRKLLEDEVPLIVISGPEGCGKTTMALAICQDEDILDKFQDNIFFIAVSKSPSLLVIAERLFQHKGQKVPKYRNENDLVVLLENFFRNMTPEPVLLVLDDLWSGSEYILDKLNFQIENYRILVTSRSELSSFDSTYKLQTLNETDALTLFRQSALPQGGNFCISDEDVNKIVNSCGGIPLAISVIGKSLYRMSAAEWRTRVKECSKASAIMSKSEFGMFEFLQSCVDALDKKAKECFIDLCSFPEDQRTSASTLIDMWVELYKIDEDDAMNNLHELRDRNLVDLVVMRKDSSDVDCSYNEHFAKQHDLLRDLAIRQSDSGSIEHRRRLFLDITGNRVEPKQLLIDANLLSISTDEMFTSDWSSLQLQAPKVEALVLNIQTKNYNLPEFVQTMIDLKVLIVTNYGFSTTELSNFELLSSLSSLRRIGLEKLVLPSSLLSSLQLKNLEKISLVKCKIREAFSSIPIQISEAIPNLAEIIIDYCNDLVELPAGFCDLFQLKRLSITNCHKLGSLPEDLGKLANMEVLRLNSCIELLELPESIGRLQKLRVLDISDCLSITELPESVGGLFKLKKLFMIDCSNCELPDSIMNLTQLKEITGDEETAASWKIFKPFLDDLEIKVHRDFNLNWLR